MAVEVIGFNQNFDKFTHLIKQSMTDVEARYYAIQQKEEELRNREKALKKSNIDIVGGEKPYNFPPFCSIVYHNIGEEIPIASQWTVRIAYIMYWCLCITCVINVIACCTTGKIDVKGYSAGKNIIFGILIGLLAVPLAFKINYYKFYTQCKDNEITLRFFALQAIYIAVYAYAAVGKKNSGTIGLITAIDALAGGKSGFCKAICMIAAVLWVAGAAIQIFLFGKIMVLYKGTGSSKQNTAA